MKKIKIYQPTKKGSAEMFSDFEKEVARDEMIENKIDDLREEKLRAKAEEDTEYCNRLEDQQFRWRGGQ